MKKLFLGISLMVLSLRLFAQDEMIVNYAGRPVPTYDGFTKPIYALHQLPPAILKNVNELMKTSLGDLNAKVRFESGQETDLGKYFEVNQVSYRSSWLVPKYQLNFVLRDSAIGIKMYAIKLRLDEYAQVLSSTWPRLGCTTESIFKSRDTIKAFALKEAVDHKFNLKNYKIEFMYDKDHETFWWRFLFPIGVQNEERGVKDYDCIDISWININNFEITKISKVTI